MSHGNVTDRIDRLLGEARRSAQELATELEQVGAQHELLVHLYVGVNQLHSSLRLPEMVSSFAETFINLIGTEDFALFVKDDPSGRFEKLWSMGAGAEKLAGFASGEGTLGACLAKGDIVY